MKLELELPVILKDMSCLSVFPPLANAICHLISLRQYSVSQALEVRCHPMQSKWHLGKMIQPGGTWKSSFLRRGICQYLCERSMVEK